VSTARKRTGLAPLVAIGAEVLFAAIAWAVFGAGFMVRPDAEWVAWLQTQATPAWVRAMRLVSDLHRPRAIVAATAVGVLVLLWRLDLAGALLLTVAVFGGATLNHLLKQGFQRPRPGSGSVLAVFTDFSFPSGHVANATLLDGALALLMTLRCGSRGLRVSGVAGATVLVVWVAASRLVLGAHYPSDVLAGAAVGLFWLALCLTAWVRLGRGAGRMHVD
jgi:membrane-associated phospholipid phosphatase